jgi:serine/threonine protein kinase
MESLQGNDPPYVGPYRLLGLLSTGGMGRVYLGESPGGRQVAVKVMLPELTANPEFRVRFKSEVAAARRVGGYHTAPVVDADPDADPPWMVTAYIPGPSLDEKVRNDGPLSGQALRELAAALAEGLAAIHASGLVHRDLKPRNILMAEDGPRIIDFGVAKPVNADATPLTSPGKIIGTPSFMSPEQVDARPLGAASDIFSLGSVLVFAATGKNPFGGPSPATYYAILHKEPDLAPVSGPLREVVRACLAKDPALRPTSAALLTTLSAIPRTLPSFPTERVVIRPAQRPAPATRPLPTRASGAQEPRVLVRERGRDHTQGASGTGRDDHGGIPGRDR